MIRLIVWLCCFVLVVGGVACGGETAEPEPPASQGENEIAAISPTATLEATAIPAPTDTVAAAATEPTPEPTLEPEPTATPLPQPTPTEAMELVKIALLDSLQLNDGQERLNWARLAVEDFNAATGWQVELVEVDTGVDGATATAAINSVVADPAIYAAIGPHRASQLLAVSAISDMVGLPHIVFNGYPGLTQSGSANLFRLAPTDDLQGTAAARFIVDMLGAPEVFVIVQAGQGSPGSYGYELYTAFEQALNAAGGSIIARAPVAADMADFSALVAQIQASGAEAIFAADTTAEQGVQIAQALREAGVDIPLIGHYGWADALLTASADGVYVLAPAPAVADAALSQRYEQQHGPSGVYGPLAYEATMVVLAAIQRAAESDQLSPAAVAEEIAATNQASTVLERPLAFTADGELQDAQFYVLQVEDDVFRTVRP